MYLKYCFYLFLIVLCLGANTKDIVLIKIKGQKDYLQCKTGGSSGYICPRENADSILVYTPPRYAGGFSHNNGYKAIGKNSSHPQLLKQYEVTEILDNEKVIFSINNESIAWNKEEGRYVIVNEDNLDEKLYITIPSPPPIETEISLKGTYTNQELYNLFNSQIYNDSANLSATNPKNEMIRNKGNEEFEQIFSKYNKNYQQNRESISSAFKEGIFSLKLQDGNKIDCEKGKDKPNIEKEIYRPKNDSRIRGCQFMHCGPFIKDNKKYNISLIFEHSIIGLDSPIALIIDEENKFVKKADIDSITAPTLKNPIYTRNYEFDKYLKTSYENKTFPPFTLDRLTKPTVKSSFELSKMYCNVDDPALSIFNKAHFNLRKDVSNKELVQLVEFVGHRISSKFETIGAVDSEQYCKKNGVYYSKNIISSPNIFSNIQEKTNPKIISINQANELFNKAKEMEDIAWGYKQDGCYARAHLVARRFEEYGIDTGKVWIKGELSIPESNIYWSYHVAPTVYVDKGNGSIERMVIDPAIANKPLSIQEWSSSMKKGTIGPDMYTSFPFPNNAGQYERTAIAFSSSNPYSPNELFNFKEDDILQKATETMKRYKQYEGEI